MSSKTLVPSTQKNWQNWLKSTSIIDFWSTTCTVIRWMKKSWARPPTNSRRRSSLSSSSTIKISRSNMFFSFSKTISFLRELKTAARSWVSDRSCWIITFSMTRKRMLWRSVPSTWMVEREIQLLLIPPFAVIYGSKLWLTLEIYQHQLARLILWERWIILVRSRTRKTKTELLKRKRRIFWVHYLYLKSFRANQISSSRLSRNFLLTDLKYKTELSEKTTHR